MGWSPFDPGWKQQASWHGVTAHEHILRLRRRRREVFVAIGIPALLIAGVACLLNFADFREFWAERASLAASLRIFAAICAAVSFLLMVRLALRRYKLEPDSVAPAWFRFALAACELVRAAGILLLVLWAAGFNFTFNGYDIFWLVLVAVGASWAAEEVLRWRGDSYGWTAGRVFDPRIF